RASPATRRSGRGVAAEEGTLAAGSAIAPRPRERRIEPACRLRRPVADELRSLVLAALERARAARMEGASGRDAVETRHAAVDLGEPCARAPERRDRAHEPDGVGMTRVLHHLAQRADLDHAAR